MKYALIGTALGIVILAAGVVALGYYLGLFGGGGATPSPSPSPGIPASPSAPSPTITPPVPSPSPSSPPSISASPSSPSPTTAPTIAPPVPSPPPSPTVTPTVVNFEMVVTGVSGSGLSRTVTAQVTNTGSSDAHAAWAKVEVFSQGQRIQLSGQDYLRVDIGTVKAGATATAQVTLSFSVFDGLKIQQNGAQFLLTIYSDERTQTLTYDYKP